MMRDMVLKAHRKSATSRPVEYHRNTASTVRPSDVASDAHDGSLGHITHYGSWKVHSPRQFRDACARV